MAGDATAGDATAGDATAGSATGGSAAPPDDQVVVALDDFAAMHALTLGVEPDLVLEVFEYESTSAVFDDLGLQTRPYGAELDLETVAGAAPDLILGVSIPTTASAQSQLDAIAPTTVVDYTAGWDEQLASVAEALGRGSTAEEIVLAMHEFLAGTPCRFVTASLYDVLGVLDQPNLPGTTDEYPNWRMPLPAGLEEIVADPRVRRVADVLGARKDTTA